MTKAEIKKQEVKGTIGFLQYNFDATDFERENQYIEFGAKNILGMEFRCSLDTRNFDVTIHENRRLSGDGWSQDEVMEAQLASDLEDRMNEEIIQFLKSLKFDE